MDGTFQVDEWYFGIEGRASPSSMPTIRELLEPLGGARTKPRLSAEELSARRAANGHRPRLVRDKGDRL